MDQRQRNPGLIGGVIKGGSFAVGLVTELQAHRKAKKSSNQGFKQQVSQNDVGEDETYMKTNGCLPTYDEEVTLRPSLDYKLFRDDEKATDLNNPFTTSTLPFPIILPQRRPNDKSRGFVRAYAPDLGKYKGIDETTFLDFLRQFHKSSQASGWFTVINIAAMGAGLAPSAIAMAVSTSVQIASRVAAEAQTRYRTNAYLDKANKELFHPKNLHCMIMTFKPEASENAVLNLDIKSDSSIAAPVPLPPFTSNTSVASGARSRGGNMFRTSDGTTQGEFAIPQAAYLTYPEPTPGEVSEANEDGLPQGKKENSWKSTGKFIADYKDRRAQAKFAATHGHDSKLAVPGAADADRFASRFSDPNWDPLAFMSGGNHLRNESKDQLQPTDRRRRDRSRDSSRDGRSGQGLIGGMKKMMQQNLLYLLIAEIPTEEEMRDLF